MHPVAEEFSFATLKSCFETLLRKDLVFGLKVKGFSGTLMLGRTVGHSSSNGSVPAGQWNGSK